MTYILFTEAKLHAERRFTRWAVGSPEARSHSLQIPPVSRRPLPSQAPPSNGGRGALKPAARLSQSGRLFSYTTRS